MGGVEARWVGPGLGGWGRGLGGWGRDSVGGGSVGKEALDGERTGWGGCGGGVLRVDLRCHTPGVERATCLASSIQALRTARALGARRNSSLPVARAVLVCTAASPAASGRMSIATGSSIDARCDRFPVRSAGTAGRVRATSVAARSPHSARRMPFEPARGPKAAGARRCAACLCHRSPPSTSPLFIRGRVPRVRQSPTRTLCAMGSVRPTNLPACGPC